ncbi:hypothetical protein KKE26_09745 [bacterium]|nr:hypothetical protein [bacterium]
MSDPLWDNEKDTRKHEEYQKWLSKKDIEKEKHFRCQRCYLNADHVVGNEEFLSNLFVMEIEIASASR